MYVCIMYVWFMYVCTYLCMYVRIYVRTYVRTYVCMYVVDVNDTGLVHKQTKKPTTK